MRFLPVPGALGLRLKWGRCSYRSYGKTELSLEEGHLTGFGPLLRTALQTPALSPNPPDNYVSPFPSHWPEAARPLPQTPDFFTLCKEILFQLRSVCFSRIRTTPISGSPRPRPISSPQAATGLQAPSPPPPPVFGFFFSIRLQPSSILHLGAGPSLHPYSMLGFRNPPQLSPFSLTTQKSHNKLSAGAEPSGRHLAAGQAG